MHKPLDYVEFKDFPEDDPALKKLLAGCTKSREEFTGLSGLVLQSTRSRP